MSNYTDDPAPPQAAPVKPATLSWWALIPAVAIVAVEIYYGLPIERFEAKEPILVPARVIGRVFGAFLISMFFSWIFYRLFRRSQRAGTFAFTIVAGLICVATVTRSPADFTLNEAGITVTSPPGWRKVQFKDARIVIGWKPPATIDRHVIGEISVDVNAASQHWDGKKVAEKMASDIGGEIIDDHASLDGETAWRIQKDSDSDSSGKPVTTDLLIAMHKHRQYMIACVAYPGHSFHEQVDFIRDHWKWIQK